MLRILSVCRTLPEPQAPGAGIFVFNRLKAMSAYASVRVMQPVPHFPAVRPLPTWALAGSRDWEGVRIHHEPMFYVPGVAKTLDGFWLSRSVRRHLSRDPSSTCDLVDAHFGYPDGVGCVRAAQQRNIPVFVTIRGLEADRMREPRIGGQIIDSLNAATGCISVSHSLRKVMIDHGVAGERIAVIPNAVDRTIFHPGDRREARHQLGLETDRRMVLSVGYLIRRKRHDVLLRAFALLADTNPDVDLVIVGDEGHEPDTPAQLRALVRSLGILDRVRFVGGVAPSIVATWMRAADVFGLATAREGCCNAVLESLATGLPVVTTPVGDNPYYVHAGCNGIVSPVDDAPALAGALESALATSWDSAAISSGLDVGTWNNVAERVLGEFSRRLAIGGKP